MAQFPILLVFEHNTPAQAMIPFVRQPIQSLHIVAPVKFYHDEWYARF